MRILLIITRGEIGGAQISVLNLAKALKNKGYHVTVGLNDERFLHESLREVGIPAITFKWLKRTINPLYNILFLREMMSFLSKNYYDIVHFNSSNALFGAIGTKLLKFSPKTVFTHHGLSLLDENYKTNLIIKYSYFIIIKFLLKFIDSNVFVCIKNYDKAINTKLINYGTVIFNGIDNDNLFFYPPEFSRNFIENSINQKIDNKFVIGSIGRLAYPKNYEFLIRIVPKILNLRDDIVFVVIGDGPEYEKYHSYISALNLNKYIFLLGSLENAYQYIKAFDIFILPSIYEGFSITLIEALSAGLPILASDVGGNAELLNYSKDQIYRLNDETDFLNKFERILSDYELKESIMKENQKLSLRYNSTNMANNYINLYQHLLKI